MGRESVIEMRNSTIYTNKPKTFRRSSTKFLSLFGSNLQNIEKLMRSIYTPDGFDPHNKELIVKCKYFLETEDLSIFSEEELVTLRVFLQIDQSGAEALIVAYESRAADYRQLFINNVKPHVYVGLKLFPDDWKRKSRECQVNITDDDIDILNLTPIEGLKKNPKWKDLDSLIKSSDNWTIAERFYYFAKQTCHSANYGIAWNTFIMNVLEKSGGKVVLTKEQGKHFLETYRSLFPEINERNERIRRQVEQYKMLYNLHGHPYTITDENITETKFKEYYAWTAQSTVAEITRIAYTNMYYWILDNNKQWDLMADGHDSYLIQAPLSDIKECASKAKEFMGQELVSPVDGVKFRMKSECQVGFNWGVYYPNNPDKNPLGLRELTWLN